MLDLTKEENEIVRACLVCVLTMQHKTSKEESLTGAEYHAIRSEIEFKEALIKKIDSQISN